MKLDWLNAKHSFSFGHWMDPERMGYRSLRVLNEDRVAPSGGFPTHPHDNMEIITYVLSGAIAHKDSMGNEEVLRAGELQRMTAGSGITHSEFNPSDSEELHLLQIWAFPEEKGLKPSYEQRRVEGDGLFLAVSRDERDGSMKVHQDLDLWITHGGEATHELAAGRGAYVHVATGTATINGEKLVAGDALAIEDEPEVELNADGTVLLFDMK